MKMKSLLATAVVLCTLSIAANGQQSMTEEDKNQIIARHQEYMNELHLTDEQKPKVEEINRTFIDALAHLKNANESRIKKFRTYKKLKTNRDEEIQKVLTDEQFQTYKANQKKTQNEIKGRRKRNLRQSR